MTEINTTEIKFEGSHNNLKELHLFLYSKDKRINVKELTNNTPGVTKAPDIIGLIITGVASIIVPLLQTWIKEYFNLKNEEKKRIKISQKRDGEFKQIEDIDNLEE